MEQMQDICRGSVGPLPLDGANSRKCLIIVDINCIVNDIIFALPFPLCWPLKICVCLPRKYGLFMLLIENNLLLPGARLHILINNIIDNAVYYYQLKKKYRINSFLMQKLKLYMA
jgi:hypothetical protein